jgi:serine phosphatase RsbU (regulator of sigma subunit)
MKTILVVEDDPAVQRGIRENLERERFRVLVERDGMLALNRARREPFDLLILDVMLPSMSGFDVCARLKEEGFSAPIFMLTGLTDEVSKLRGLGLGADDYLSKPFSVQELLLRVRNSLDRGDRSLGKVKALQQEFRKAREIQRNALPTGPPKVKGLDVFGTMIPATEVGGDYFDYLSLGSDHFAVVVADVSGKGMPAALHVHKMQGVVQASRTGISGATDLLLQLQEHLGSTLEDASFVTAVAAVFDVKGKSVEIASAGHPPVFYKRGSRLYEVPAEGMIIGQAMGSLFSELLKPARVSLEPGDMFFFYSDGIPEAMNSRQKEFGFDRFKRVLSETQGTSLSAVRHCLRNIRTFAGNAPQSDDITLVAAKAPLGAKNR